MRTTLKIAVFAPIPSAIVTIATIAKPGFFTSVRVAYLRSLITASIPPPPRSSRFDPIGVPACRR